MTTVPLARPFLDEDEEAEVVAALRSGWISQGPKVAAFERGLAERLRVDHVRAVNSGTSAIHLALLACGVGPGDEVIVPAFTCIAAVHPIVTLGAVPVPVDIEDAGYGLTVEGVAARLGERTRVVMVAHLFGYASRTAALRQLAARNGSRLLEDLALGLGAAVDGAPAGAGGDAAILSFHPRKMLTTGEGGAVATADPALAATVESLRNYGSSVSAWARHNTDVSRMPEFGRTGFNCKMTDLQAGVGLAQLRKLDRMIELRQRLAARYDAALAGLAWLEVPRRLAGVDNCYQSYVVRCGARDDSLRHAHAVRQALAAHLQSRGIASVQAAQVVSDFQHYRGLFGWREEDMPAALRADRCTLALPMYPGLTDALQDEVCDAVRRFSPPRAG